MFRLFRRVGQHDYTASDDAPGHETGFMRYRLTDETIYQLLPWIGATHASEPSPL
ncbi:hypothetical protein ABZW96_31330 [Nocardia sp. NPDC004168]|uniref:hypothetical protein n=1 Tax=Nocardia TaxID=1817 RepID=UPI0033AF28B8